MPPQSNGLRPWLVHDPIGGKMNRRGFLSGASAFGAAIAAPNIMHAQGASVLKIIPAVGLSVLDPIANTSQPTRNHAFAVFDMLYGLDLDFNVHPQMVEGHTVDADKKIWTLKLRKGLRFHDGQPVRGQDVVASLQRWAKRDSYGKLLFDRLDEVSAPSDNEVRFRLNKPYAHLPSALAKMTSYVPVIMPERLAAFSDPTMPVSEIVGSGPYRFVPGEFVSGAKVVYEKFADYVPRDSGPVGNGSGPKIAYFERVENHIFPDPGSAMSAMQAGEMDWWERPLPDMVQALSKHRGLVLGPSGTQVIFMRPNHLTKPFDNPEIRRLVLSCIDQNEFVQATSGEDQKGPDVGIFTGSMKTSVGLAEAFRKRKDFDNVRKELSKAGYNGEPLALMVPADTPFPLAASEVGADLFKKMGFNVDYQAVDYGTLSQRRTSAAATEKGGWSAFFTNTDTEYFLDQAANFVNRGAGKDSWFGWPTSPKIEALNAAWTDETDLDKQRTIADDIQLQCWQDVPYIPCGSFETQRVSKNNLTDFAPGFPKFFGVRRV